MQKALKQYERNLKMAKSAQKDEIKVLEDAVEMEKTHVEASKLAKGVVKESLGNTLVG